jgi:hypothetical protein
MKPLVFDLANPPASVLKQGLRTEVEIMSEHTDIDKTILAIDLKAEEMLREEKVLVPQIHSSKAADER